MHCQLRNTEIWSSFLMQKWSRWGKLLCRSIQACLSHDSCVSIKDWSGIKHTSSCKLCAPHKYVLQAVLLFLEINNSWNISMWTQECRRTLRRLNMLLCCCRKKSCTQKNTWVINFSVTTHQRENTLQHTCIFTKDTEYH